MIVDHIHEHRQPQLVGGLHEALECVRAAVTALHAEDIDWVVTQSKLPGNSLMGMTSTALTPSCFKKASLLVAL